MDICLPIRDIYVRKILDSGGSPAVEAEVLHQLQDKKVNKKLRRELSRCTVRSQRN